MNQMKMVSISEQEQSILDQYKDELRDQLNEIIAYWSEHTVDATGGGFYGAVANNNIPDVAAAKGLVLNSRILWTFSSAMQYADHPSLPLLANRAFEYIFDHFIDPEYGGAFWLFY